MRALLRMSREITSALDLDRLLLTAANILARRRVADANHSSESSSRAPASCRNPVARVSDSE